MRIHTSLTEQDVYDAARASGTDLERFTTHRSRSHVRAFDVYLTGSSSRRPNSGRFGAGDPDVKAATWDEWGIFLGYLFDRDVQMNATYYRDADDFHWQTGDRFELGALKPSEQHRQHRWTFEGTVGESGCKCGAKHRAPAPVRV